MDGNIKLILGLLWSVFRRLRNEQLNVGDSAKEEEQALLAWVKEQTKGYKGVEIKGWKDSWHDGLAFSALIHKFDPSLINYDAINPVRTRLVFFFFFCYLFATIVPLLSPTSHDTFPRSFSYSLYYSSRSRTLQHVMMVRAAV